jgi:hypothetical protein
MPNERKNPPPHCAAQIETLAATGFSKVGIAAHFGVSVNVLDRWLDENDRLKTAFEVGRDQERQALHNSLYKAAIDGGDKVAAMFLLKSRHGYREGDQSDQANRVSVVFNIPGALTAEQYKVINGDTGNPNKQLPIPTVSRS